EALREDADDRVRIAVQQDRLANNRLIAAEVRHPETVGQYRDVRCADAVLVFGERAADGVGRAEDAEVRRGHVNALDLLRQSGSAQVEARPGGNVGGDRIQRLRLRGAQELRDRFGALRLAA